jgi:hypothetical protein
VRQEDVEAVIEQVNKKKKIWPGPKERRAYIVLVCISVVLSLGAFFLSLQVMHAHDRIFCDITQAVIKNPVAPPTNPKEHQSQQQNYEWYVRFVHLDHNLDCPP